MFDMKEAQFLLKLIDSATVKGIEANQMIVQIALKMTKLQKQLSVEAIASLQQPPKAPALEVVPKPDIDQVSEDEEMVPE